MRLNSSLRAGVILHLPQIYSSLKVKPEINGGIEGFRQAKCHVSS